jgi:hypothetical protein
MDNTKRRHDNPESSPEDGPLTRLLNEDEAERPHPPETKHEGRDDYAQGTPEHEDDREM